MQASYLLGIDCGGTYLKAGLYDGKGREIAITRKALTTLSEVEGYAERDMHILWEDCASCIKEVILKTGVDAKSIKAIGISAQGKGLFLLDKEGKPLGNAILSSDKRSMPIVKDWLQDGIKEKLYPITKQTLWCGHPVSILRYLKDYENSRYQKIGSIMMGHDYLRYCLTEVKAAERSNISESNLYNMKTRTYDKELAEILGISEIFDALPPIVDSSEVAGTVTKEVALKTGLAEGTLVVGGLFDVVSTALCAGLKDESNLNAVMGTWAVTSGIANSILENESHPFVYGEFVSEGQYIVHEASPTSSGNLEWFNHIIGDIPYDQLNEQIAKLPKASSDLFFLPFVYGSNAGLEMKGSFYGLQTIHTKAHMAQAVYEGVIFSHMTHVNRIRERFKAATTLRVTGGSTHSPVWMQMFADISGMTIELPQVEETGCSGAALAAGVGAGIFKNFTEAQQSLQYEVKTIQPDLKLHELYREKYAKYQALVSALQSFHKSITKGPANQEDTASIQDATAAKAADAAKGSAESASCDGSSACGANACDKAMGSSSKIA